MKKLVFAICMVFGAVAVNAQDSTQTSPSTDPSINMQQETSMEDQGRVKIKSQELPDAVKSSLEGQEYRGWLVSSAYKVDASANTSTGNTSGETGNTPDQTGNTSGQTGTTSDTTSVSGDAQTGAYAQEVYIVELKNGAQTKTVRFDKDGKKLDDGEDDMGGDQK